MKPWPASVATMALLVAALSACTDSSAPSGPEPEGVETITNRDITLAETLVHLELSEERQEDAVIDSVSVTIGKGAVTQSNTGHTCDSGGQLRIRLIGTFPHIVTTGLPTAGAGSEEDTAVRAVLLTADRHSGHVCLVSVRTGDVAPEPDATILDVD